MLPQLWHAAREFSLGLLAWVYPPICWVCRQEATTAPAGICPACSNQLLFDPHDTCPRCSSSVGPYSADEAGCILCRDSTYHFTRTFRMGPYEGLLREVILRMKQPEGEGLAEAVGTLWAKAMALRLRPHEPQVVLPVPLHWSRRWWRGYNQSDVLARCLARELGVPCLFRGLRRRRRTPQQTLQTTQELRRANVRQAFHALPALPVRNHNVVLVDDVLTSGSTASEAARALKPLEPARILVAVLAHGK